jgi:DNA-binding transcriptional regulator YiaG
MTPTELKQWRESLGFSQLDFGQWLKPRKTPGTICAWEKGRSPIPEWLDLVKEKSDARRG